MLEGISLQNFFQLFLAAILGAIIGLEREYRKKEAGMRTYCLVTLGSCLFTIVSFGLFDFFPDKSGIKFDPAAIIQAIAIGIGFLGAGVIFRQQMGVVGLTTAAGLWVAAAIGVAIGAALYWLAVFATILTFLIFASFGLLEEKILKTRNAQENK